MAASDADAPAVDVVVGVVVVVVVAVVIVVMSVSATEDLSQRTITGAFNFNPVSNVSIEKIGKCFLLIMTMEIGKDVFKKLLTTKRGSFLPQP